MMEALLSLRRAARRCDLVIRIDTARRLARNTRAGVQSLASYAGEAAKLDASPEVLHNLTVDMREALVRQCRVLSLVSEQLEAALCALEDDHEG